MVSTTTGPQLDERPVGQLGETVDALAQKTNVPVRAR
jgi:hypothetical protein